MFIWMFLTHTSFSNKLFCEELQTYRALFIRLCCFVLLCQILIFRKTWLYVQREGKELEMHIRVYIHVVISGVTAWRWIQVGHKFECLHSSIGAVTPVLSSGGTCPPGIHQGCSGTRANYFKLAQVNFHKLCSKLQKFFFLVT